MRMTAAVMYEQGLPKPYAQSTPFRIEDVDLEGPGEGEVLIEVQAAGLCHSDLSQVAGLRKRKVPVVGGHEAAGIVREVGRGVTDVAPDDHVVMSLVTGCGHCRPCIKSRPSLCEAVTASRTQGVLGNGARRLSRNGAPIYHYSGLSGFAQYAVVLPGSLIKMDRDIPFEDAAIFGCAVTTGVGAVFNTARVPPGASVAVLGLGGVGLNAIMAARIAGAAKIIGIDVNPDKFPLARELGATETISATDPDCVTKVRDLTKGGVDFAFEVVGVKPAFETAFAITAKGGEVIAVGIGASDDLYQYKHAALVSEEKVIRGSFMGSSVPQRDLPLYLSLYKDGRLPVGRLKSEQIGFDRLNASLDLLDRGVVVRQILRPHR
jgi:Zn-dependent alcohol dehydrogenase